MDYDIIAGQDFLTGFAIGSPTSPGTPTWGYSNPTKMSGMKIQAVIVGSDLIEILYRLKYQDEETWEETTGYQVHIHMNIHKLGIGDL